MLFLSLAGSNQSAESFISSSYLNDILTVIKMDQSLSCGQKRKVGNIKYPNCDHLVDWSC